MLLTLLRLSCLDPPGMTDVNWQNTLMDRFFADIPTRHLTWLSCKSFCETGLNNYCNGFWTRISCDGTRITGIHYIDLRVGNFRLNELPPTLEWLSIDRCKQTGTFHTRKLPRTLINLSLSLNKLSGRLDLTTLPEDLVEAYFCENRFTGPICLCRLPKSLKHLEVHANLITQEVVWYDNLPHEIIAIRLQNNGERKVGRICELHPTTAVDPKIFLGMPPSAIE